jgi:hypothetical protein
MPWLAVTEYLCHRWLHICSVCRNNNPVPSSFITYNQVCKKSNTANAKCGAKAAYPSEASKFTPGICGIHVARSLVFCVVFSTLLFVLFLLTIVLSVLRLTDSDFLFGIFKPFLHSCCLYLTICVSPHWIKPHVT